MPILWWHRTWYAPCNDVTHKGVEFVRFEVPQNTTDRLMSYPVQPAKSGNAMRVEVRPGDWGWNPDANNGQGAVIPGGWRAEAQGPTELQADQAVGYSWSTMLDPTYVTDPRVNDAVDPNNGKSIWQVITQWHQSDSDRGSSPPVAFIIVGNNILLDVHRYDPANENYSIQVGQWPVATLNRGAWHDFEAEIRWHPTDGTIKITHNGSPVMFSPQVPPDAPNEPLYPTQTTENLTGLGTLFPPKTGSMAPPSAYFKIGLYRKAVTTNPPGPFILYHDEISRYERGFRWGPFPWPIGWPWWPYPTLPFKVKLPKLPWPWPWPPPWPPWRGRGGTARRS
jgi:hypothetical protein